MLIKLLPWAGYPIAVALFFLWVGIKEDLAAEIERCNLDKMESVALAEKAARDAITASMNQRIADLEALALQESRARIVAEEARMEAETVAINANDNVLRLMREAEESDNAPIEMACLNTDIPDAAISGMRD